MRKNYKSFSFNSDSASFRNVLNVTLSDEFYEDCIRGSRSIVVDKIPGRDIPYFYEVDDEQLEFDVTFAFERPLTRLQIKDLTKKLLAPKTYKQLTFGEFVSNTYTAKTPVYNAIFDAEADFNFIQASDSVNFFEVQSTSTVYAPDFVKASYTPSNVKASTNTSYSRTGGSILSGEDTITGITNFTDLRVGQLVYFGATLLGTITDIDTDTNVITISASSASTRTGTFTFHDLRRLTLANLTNISVRDLLTGTNVSAGTYIDSFYNIASSVVELTEPLTGLISGINITYWKVNKLVVANTTGLLVNQYITAGSAYLTNKQISSIDVGTNTVTLYQEATQQVGSSGSPVNITFTGPTYDLGNTTLNFSSGTYYNLMAGNKVTAKDSSGNFIKGAVVSSTSTSVVINVESANGYEDLVNPDIYIDYISVDNGFIGYFTLHVLCDRPYGFNTISVGNLAASAVSSLSVSNTGDIDFYPTIEITAVATTSNWIRIRNSNAGNDSTLTFKGLQNTEAIKVNADLKTITSTGTNIYTRWGRDDLYLNAGSNALVVEVSSDSGANWTSYGTGVKLKITGEAPVYIYQAE